MNTPYYTIPIIHALLAQSTEKVYINNNFHNLINITVKDSLYKFIKKML